MVPIGTHQTTWWGAPAPDANAEKEAPEAVNATAGLFACRYVGGIGFALQAGHDYWFGVGSEALRWCTSDGVERLSLQFADVLDAETSGAGVIRTGGGLVGGGVGLQAAVAGIIAASVVNAQDGRTRVDSKLRVIAANAEANFSFKDVVPQRISLELAPLRIHIRGRALSTERETQASPGRGVLNSLERLAALHERGYLTVEEFQQQKQLLLGEGS